MTHIRYGLRSLAVTIAPPHPPPANSIRSRWGQTFSSPICLLHEQSDGVKLPHTSSSPTCQLHEPDGVDPRQLRAPHVHMDLAGPQPQGMLGIVKGAGAAWQGAGEPNRYGRMVQTERLPISSHQDASHSRPCIMRTSQDRDPLAPERLKVHGL